MTTAHNPGSSPQSQPVLKVDDFAVSFANGDGPRVQAVDGVRLSVFPRQTLAMVGESGCGKSVTALSAMQLIPRPPARFDRGSITFRAGDADPVDLTTLDPRQMRAIRGNEVAMIFQEPMTCLNPVFTIGEQIIEAIMLHQRASKPDATQSAIDAMSDVGIPNPAARLKAYPHQFSGGMRQRVMIAMALACRPRLLLADEPTTALDVTIQAQILELLRSLRQSRDMAIILITHDLGVVAENADTVCVMYSGRVVEYAPVLELFDHPLHPYTRGLLASIPRLGSRLERLVTVSDIVTRPDEFEKLPGADRGLRPWWPWHQPPKDLARRDSPSGEYCLYPVSPSHYVGVWRTGVVAEHVDHTPMLATIRTREPEAARA